MNPLSFHLSVLFLFLQVVVVIEPVHAVNPRLFHKSKHRSKATIESRSRNHSPMAASRHHSKRDQLLNLSSDLNFTVSSISDLLGTPVLGGNSASLGQKLVVAQ